MKYVVIIMIGLCSCSKSKVERAKESIRKHLSKTMLDFKSYEPVEFGKLDSTFSDYKNSIRADSLQKDIDYSLQLATQLKESGEKSDAKASIYGIVDLILRQVDSLTKLRDKEESEFHPAFAGYTLTHTYRGKNALGATIITTDKFLLDTKFVVIGKEKNEEDEALEALKDLYK